MDKVAETYPMLTAEDSPGRTTLVRRMRVLQGVDDVDRSFNCLAGIHQFGYYDDVSETERDQTMIWYLR